MEDFAFGNVIVAKYEQTIIGSIKWHICQFD